MENKLIKLFSDHGIYIDEDTALRFDEFYKQLIFYNNSFNLTAIVEKDEVYVKHFLDSSLIGLINLDISGKKVIDVGSGAGFPGIPIALLYRDINMNLLETTSKKAKFLNETKLKLALSNIFVLNERAEDAGRNPDLRETFDIAVSRAVADLSILAEYMLPLIITGGYMVCYKGGNADPEIMSAKNAISCLGGEYVRSFTFELPDNQGSRTLVLIKKISSTPNEYPRRAGIPSKRPIR